MVTVRFDMPTFEVTKCGVLGASVSTLGKNQEEEPTA